MMMGPHWILDSSKPSCVLHFPVCPSLLTRLSNILFWNSSALLLCMDSMVKAETHGCPVAKDPTISG